MSSATNETTTTSPFARMTMSGGALLTPDVMTAVRAGTAPTGRMAMTTGPKTTAEVASAAVATTERTDDHAAWAAGEWAIVGARRPAKRAPSRARHVGPTPMKQAAWAAGEWAMPDAGSNEELD